MAKITTKERNKLPASEFAEPGKRKYPVDTPGRARNALARVSQFGSPNEKKTIKLKVERKYPSIKVGGKKSSDKSKAYKGK